MTKITTAEAYEQRIRGVFGLDADGETEWRHNNIAEARVALKDMRFKQKSLRMNKKEINQDIKVIRQHYREKAANTGYGAELLGFVIGRQRARYESKRSAKNCREAR